MMFDMSKLDPTDTYKLLVATVVPRPIAWITVKDVDGTLNAAPFSFFNAMSGHPPVVCFGIGGRGPGDAKDTGNIIRRTGEFVVNLVSDELAEAMNITAIDFDSRIDEFHEAGITAAPSTKVKAPRILEAPVAMECERLVIVDVGIDRSVVLGRVVAMHIKDEFVMDPAKCYIDTPKLNLVGRMHGRGWYTRTTDRFELPRIDVGDWNLRSKTD